MTDHRHDCAALVAAQICNTLSADIPKAELFGRVLFLIISAMQEADARLNRFEPSRN